MPLPREVEQFLYYFCGDAANPQALRDTESLRITFYKAESTFVRAYADIAQNLAEAGYSDAEASALKKEVELYGDTRNAIKHEYPHVFRLGAPQPRHAAVWNAEARATTSSDHVGAQ